MIHVIHSEEEYRIRCQDCDYDVATTTAWAARSAKDDHWLDTSAPSHDCEITVLGKRESE